MRINSIDFPDKLIESIQNKELVIFAGAGVSMGKPTCLPDFAKLTRLIAKDTRHKLGRRKDYEVFLGELKDNFGSGDGPNVNKLAADILIKKCKSPNCLHKAIRRQQEIWGFLYLFLMPPLYLWEVIYQELFTYMEM